MAKSTVTGAFFIFRQPERQLPTVTTKSNIGTLKDKNQHLWRCGGQEMLRYGVSF
ncbi:MAG: hypothetical protein IJ187_08165 [Neisseriaceae bacterium]|nr:hypothetical protein [Neisseriaceae bacterium]